MNLIHGNVDGSDEYESNRGHEAKAASKAALIPSYRFGCAHQTSTRGARNVE